MAPLLMLDFYARNFAAGSFSADGVTFWSHRVRESFSTRYLTSEFLVPSHSKDRSLNAWSRISKHVTGRKLLDWNTLVLELGLKRPWELDSLGTQGSAIRHPLWVLSDVSALTDGANAAVLEQIAFALLDSALAPFLSKWSIGFQVIAVVPSWLSRVATQVLEKVLRHRGCKRTRLIRREHAAALAVVGDESVAEILVVESEETVLHLHRVDVLRSSGMVECRLVESRSVRDLGWGFWVEQLQGLLVSRGLLDAVPNEQRTRVVDRGLLRLIWAPYALDSTEFPELTFTLVESLLKNPLWRQKCVDELARRLEQPIRELALSEDCPWTGLGTAFSFPQLESLVHEAIGLQRTPLCPHIPSFDRAVQGLAAGLRWRSGKRRQVSLTWRPRLMLDSLRKSSLELFSANWPETKGTTRFRQRVKVEGDVTRQPTLPVRLHHGTNPESQFSTIVCHFELSPWTSGEALEINLDLWDSQSRTGLIGQVALSLEGASAFGEVVVPSIITDLKGDLGRDSVGKVRPIPLRKLSRQT